MVLLRIQAHLVRLRMATRLAVLAAVAVQALWAYSVRAAEPAAAPTEAEVATLVRETLADPSGEALNWRDFEGARVLDFELLGLQRIGPGRWRADVDMVLDFGPAPAAVLGYQRERRGLYRLDIRRDGDGFSVLRFNAAGSVQRLPGEV